MKKNVLFIIESLKSWWWAEKACVTVGTKLYEKWYNVHYLTFYDYPRNELYDFKWKYFSLNKKQIDSGYSIFKKVKEVFFDRWKDISKCCKENNIDVCISFMEGANFSNIFSKFLWNKSKIVVSIHNSIKKNIYYKFAIKLLYNFPDKVITVAKEEKESLMKNYWVSGEKIRVIYNAIDIGKINFFKKEYLDEEEKRYFKNGKFTFLNVWRLVYQKNQELLINVFKKFNEKYKNSQLIILWEWELRKELENQIWDNKNIHLLWLKKNPYKYMYNSDCFVFSSRYEWFGIVLIEAMACWLPIISTDCSTWPKEILRKDVKSFEPVKSMEEVDYGILVPVNNEEELFKAMERMYLDEKLRRGYSEKGIERARDFDLDKIVGEWEKILSK